MRNSWIWAFCTLVLGACAQQHAAPATVDFSTAGHGRIIAARVVSTPKDDQLQRIAAALAASGVAGAPASPIDSGPVPTPMPVPMQMTEYIVRQDGGRTVSIVQAGMTKMQAGETVLILPGLHPGDGVRLLPDI